MWGIRQRGEFWVEWLTLGRLTKRPCFWGLAVGASTLRGQGVLNVNEASIFLFRIKVKSHRTVKMGFLDQVLLAFAC